jgi:peptide/nickel transport system substrate-binding protein
MAKSTSSTARVGATAATLSLILLSASCARSPGPTLPQDNSLTVALESAPINLDPRLATDQASSRVFEVMLNGLVTKDRKGNFIPDLAERWEILDGGPRYRFYLRPGVTFHDGAPLTASDVVWTFQTILDGDVPSPKKGAFHQLDHVIEVDEHTVDFVMNEPFGAMLSNLTTYLGIIPHGSQSDSFNRRPIGTGPFRLVERQPDKLTFEAFDSHWRGRPLLDRLILREVPDATVRALELRKGSVHLVVSDLAPDVLPRFRNDPAFNVVQDPGAKYAYLGLNLEDPILSLRPVRQAIARALDRQRLVDTLWRGLGTVTETILPPGHWAHHEGLELIPYDPVGARRLLDGAGFPDPDGKGPRPRFRLTFKTSTDETALLQAQILQAMLAEVGVEIEIRSYEFATFYSDIKKGSFQMFSLVWTSVIEPDLFSAILHSKSIPPAGANRGRYRNPEFDRLVDAGARLAAPEERRPFYLEAQEILARDLPYISLFIKSTFAVMPAELAGYQNYPSGELYSLKQVHWARSPSR